MDLYSLFRGSFTELQWEDDLHYRNHKHVLLKLVIEGPRSIWSIRRKIDDAELLLRGIPVKYGFTRDYEQVRRAVVELKLWGLIKKVNISKREREVVGPTFLGVFWYLRYSGLREIVEERIKYIFNSDLAKSKGVFQLYQEIIPFWIQWDAMIKEIGEEKCFKKLAATIDGFLVKGKTLIEVKPLGIKLETYQPFIDILKMDFLQPKAKENFPREKDVSVTEYLKTEEAKPLREAYITYLINGDLNSLSQIDEDEVKQKLPKLKSVKEYAFFEKGKNLIFSKEGLTEFFPRYSEIEYYFTGMFVNNLLWNQKTTTDDDEQKAQ